MERAPAGQGLRSTRSGGACERDLGSSAGAPAYPRTRGARSSGWRVTLLVGALAWGCGGQTDGPTGGGGASGGAAGGSGAGGSGGVAGSTGGAAGSGGSGLEGGTGGLGWTDCTTPDIAFCGFAECQSCPGGGYCPDIDSEDVAPMDVCLEGVDLIVTSWVDDSSPGGA